MNIKQAMPFIKRNFQAMNIDGQRKFAKRVEVLDAIESDSDEWINDARDLSCEIVVYMGKSGYEKILDISTTHTHIFK